jgi:hypothetical protein
VYKVETILKKRKKGWRVQYLVKLLRYPESFNIWIFKQDIQKRDVVVWSVSLANGTERHGQSIVLGDLLKEDSTFGGRIFVSGTHPVHGYRSQHSQLGRDTVSSQLV